MAKYILKTGKHSGFTKEGDRKIYKAGEVIELDSAAAKNMAGKVISLEEFELQQKIDNAKVEAELRVKQEAEDTHNAEQAKMQAEAKAALAEAKRKAEAEAKAPAQKEAEAKAKTA